MECHVSSYFQALLGLQASELFQQVAGPLPCPPAPEEQAPRGPAGPDRMRARRESGFSAAFLGGTHVIVFNNWPALGLTNCSLLQIFPVPHQGSRGHSVRVGSSEGVTQADGLSASLHMAESL